MARAEPEQAFAFLFQSDPHSYTQARSPKYTHAGQIQRSYTSGHVRAVETEQSLTLVSLLFINEQLTDRDTVSLMKFAILTFNMRDYHG